MLRESKQAIWEQEDSERILKSFGPSYDVGQGSGHAHTVTLSLLMLVLGYTKEDSWKGL